MSYDVEVRILDQQEVVTIRTTATPDTIGEQFGLILPEIMAYLNAKDILPDGPAFARYHEFQLDFVDMEVGFPISSIHAGEPVAPADERITSGELPAGRAAVVVHRGAYPGLHAAYMALEEWIRDSGEDATGPLWEVYVTGMQDTQDPAALVTEVVWPLKG